MGPLGEPRPEAYSPLRVEAGAENSLPQGSRELSAAQGSESRMDHPDLLWKAELKGPSAT